MGMFDWLFQTEKEHAKYLPEDRGLPEPTRVAPMPACKPPKQLDISEPVIKLLAMLDEDVWEVSKVLTSQEYPYETYKYGLRHVYREDFSVVVEAKKFVATVGGSGLFGHKIVDASWLTKDEVKSLSDKIIARSSEISDLNRYTTGLRERELYKQFLDTV